MTIVSITYPAKCKDCQFIKPIKIKNTNRNICTNPESTRYDPNPFLSRVALKDKACDKFQL
jgi:hypothetical protein